MTPKKHWESVDSRPTNSPIALEIRSKALSKYTNYQVLVERICSIKDQIISSENGNENLTSLIAQLPSYKEKVQFLIASRLISIGHHSFDLMPPGIFPIIVDFIRKEVVWI